MPTLGSGVGTGSGTGTGSGSTIVAKVSTVANPNGTVTQTVTPTGGKTTSTTTTNPAIPTAKAASTPSLAGGIQGGATTTIISPAATGINQIPATIQLQLQNNQISSWTNPNTGQTFYAPGVIAPASAGIWVNGEGLSGPISEGFNIGGVLTGVQTTTGTTTTTQGGKTTTVANPVPFALQPTETLTIGGKTLTPAETYIVTNGLTGGSPAYNTGAGGFAATQLQQAYENLGDLLSNLNLNPSVGLDSLSAATDTFINSGGTYFGTPSTLPTSSFYNTPTGSISLVGSNAGQTIASEHLIQEN